MSQRNNYKSHLFAAGLMAFGVLHSGCVMIDGEFRFNGPEVVGNFQKVDAVGAAVLVEVKTGSGDTVVYGRSENQVRVEGKIHVRARDTKRGEEVLAQIIQAPPVVVFGQTVTVGELDRARFSDYGITIDYTIYMPRTGHLRSRSGSGDQTVRDIDGDVELNSGSGDLHGTNLGSRFTARVGSGSIKLSDVKGPVEVNASSGDVTGENLAGRTEVSTSSGDIRLSFVGDDLRVHSSSGSITIHESKSSVRARASSGDISIDSVLAPNATWDVEATSGDVDFKLPSQARFGIDAVSRSGGVESAFPSVTIDEQHRRQSLRGDVGTDGGRIQCRTASGRIRLRKS